jgi:hypothetical protein
MEYTDYLSLLLIYPTDEEGWVTTAKKKETMSLSAVYFVTHLVHLGWRGTRELCMILT